MENGWMNGWLEGRWMDGWMGEQMEDGWMDGDIPGRVVDRCQFPEG